MTLYNRVLIHVLTMRAGKGSLPNPGINPSISRTLSWRRIGPMPASFPPLSAP